MKRSIIQFALIATAMLLSVSLSVAAESKNAPSGEAKAAAPAKAANPKSAAAKAKKVKYVDINSAGKAELMKLQGIDGALADRIIAGRPYLSKAHLVTHKVIPQGIYEQNKRQIVALQKPAARKK